MTAAGPALRRRPRLLPRSLFARLFLAFLLAMVVAGGGFLALTFALRNDPLVVRSYVNGSGLLAIAARRPAEQFEAGGAPAAERALAELSRATGLELTLLDGRARRVLAGEFPAVRGARRLAFAAAFRGPAMPPATAPQQFLTAVAVETPSGSRYVVLGRMQGSVAGSLYGPVLRTAFVVLVAAVICALLARSLTRPLEAVRGAARRLAAGDLSARAGLHPALRNRQDEIAELGEDFDAMASRLGDAVQAQRQLLADISHELRSPLARLNVALELARQRDKGGTVTAPLDRIERETERLNALIGELITLTRMEAGEAARERRPVELDALVRAVAEDADFEAQARGCRVELVRADAVTLRGEEELLRRAVENVVRNAVRYTAEGTAVEVSLRREGTDAVITVRDHGPGVPPECLADLWRPFFRVADDRARASGGVGLGLSIAERAVRLHGGTAAAENAAGGGLLVTLTLPAAK